MTLKTYKTKRNFKSTPEPTVVKPKASTALHFVVQKHAARRLHYDFRLECRGVLLSWAIPKGPSLNPSDKRLAIHVEDHPIDYQYFEGVIPKGNYGAGTVEIWDKGTFTTPFSTDRKEIEKYLSEGMEKGHLAVILHGERLNGEFVFQKLKESEKDNAWIVIKKGDTYSQVSNSKAPKKKAKMPEFFSPMLSTLIDKPFNSEEWLFEVKWDGYRALAFVNDGKVKLLSRNDKLQNNKFSAIVQQLEKIESQVILDGELVVVDSKGISHFQLMQNYQKEKKGDLLYYVFDLVYKDGEDLRELPLIERKEALKKFLSDLRSSSIRYSDHIVKEGVGFFKKAQQLHLEGIIGKKMSSTYQSRRSSDWVKIKTLMRQEVVIGGFTAPRGSRKKFGALLVGVYNDKKELLYAGHVGGGFDEALLEDMFHKLKPLIQKQSPFKENIKPNAPVTWVKPKLVCEVSFSEWTQDNSMRQPIFQGLREDKEPTSVAKEIPHQAKTAQKASSPTFSNLNKYYWPKEKITKGELLSYYESIAPYILPHLKDRLIVLYRFPEGIETKGFYQKDLGFTPPKGIKTFPLTQEGKVNHYLLIDNLESLLFAVNLGSIDLHPFMSRTKTLEYPDYCVIDLDPHDIAFDHVVEAALVLHDLLNKIKVKHYCKTSGGKGLHILIPFHAKYTYDQSRQFAEVLATIVHQELPKTTSLERAPEKRPKKIYLDYMQNRYGQTITAPYCVRPRPGAVVSMPLSWDEVNKDLDLKNYTIKNALARLKKTGDILKPVLKESINLEATVNKLKAILKN